MTFLDVVNSVIAAATSDSARRATVTRLLAVLGHETPPEVWRCRWEGRMVVAYNWPGAPGGDLWLAGGRLHEGLSVEGDVLKAPAAPVVQADPPTAEIHDDFLDFERIAPAEARALRKKLQKVVPLLREAAPILIPPARRDEVLASMRRAVAAMEAA